MHSWQRHYCFLYFLQEQEQHQKKEWHHQQLQQQRQKQQQQQWQLLRSTSPCTTAPNWRARVLELMFTPRSPTRQSILLLLPHMLLLHKGQLGCLLWFQGTQAGPSSSSSPALSPYRTLFAHCLEAVGAPQRSTGKALVIYQVI